MYQREIYFEGWGKIGEQRSHDYNAAYFEKFFAGREAEEGGKPLCCAGCQGLHDERKLFPADVAELHDTIKFPIRTSVHDPKGVPMVIEGFTAHQLRHTYASILYMAGVDVVTAKELMGHADIQTTLEIYTHLSKTYKKKEVSKLDEYLANAE